MSDELRAYDLGNGETVLTTEKDARGADFDRDMHGMCVFKVVDGIARRLELDEWPDWTMFHARVGQGLVDRGEP